MTQDMKHSGKASQKDFFHKIINKNPSRLFHPWMILCVVVLPQLGMLFLARQDYTIVRHLLSEDERNILVFFGSTLLSLLGFTLVTLLYFAFRKRRLPMLATPIFLIGAYGLWAFFFLWFKSDIEWAKVPTWMMDYGNIFVYPATFLAPSLFLGLLELVHILSPPELDRRHVFVNFFLTIIMPFLVYLFLFFFDQYFTTLGRHSEIFAHLYRLGFLAVSFAFFFLLLRSMYLLSRLSVFHAKWAQNAFLLVRRYLLPAAILVFPQLGLIFNNHGELIGMEEFTYVFGNFSHPLFYLLAFLNSLLLILPKPTGRALRGLLTALRIFLLPFSLYFLLVFLPWFPLALLAIIAVGAGFLMLTPILVFFFHILRLMEDYEFWKEKMFKRRLPAAIAALALFSILPAAVYLTYASDRRNLHDALDYVYTPDFGDSDAALRIDRERLKRTLENLRSFKIKSATPYLDSLYRGVVLDNLTLSDQKIATLERIFFGSETKPARPRGASGFFASRRTNRRGSLWMGRMRPPLRSGVILASLKQIPGRDSEDIKKGYMRSYVELRIRNTKEGQREYYTSFPLPEDAFIKNHYLVINGRKEYGILAEKKSALWVYRQITQYRRDPSILYYKNPTELVLRVFPVTREEPRIAGFEILHRRTLQLRIDGHRLTLQGSDTQTPKSPKFAATGKPMARWDVILDCSVHNQKRKAYLELLQKFMEEFAKENKIHDGGASLVQEGPFQIHCMNYANRRISLQKLLARDERTAKADLSAARYPLTGGFFLGRAVSEAYFRAYRTNKKNRKEAKASGRAFRRVVPKFLVLGPAPKQTSALFVERHHSFSWLSLGDPKLYYISLAPRSGKKYTFQTFSLLQESPFQNRPTRKRLLSQKEALFKLRELLRPQGLLYPKDRLVLSPEEIEEEIAGEQNSYATGLRGLALFRKQSLFPSDDRLWRELLRNGFRSGVLNPALASIALENEAQKEALRRKQEQVLRGHRGLDLEEEPPPAMDEPELLVLLGILFLVLLFVYRHQLSKMFSKLSHSYKSRAKASF